MAVEDVKLKCIDPTSTLTEGKVYTTRRLAEKSGNMSSHGVEWDRATHVVLNNDNGNTIKTKAKRFERYEQKEG